MRTVDLNSAVAEVCAHLRAASPLPRIVASGNFASPWEVLDAILADHPDVRLHMLNAQPHPLPEQVVPETAFVGPGVRRNPALRYLPSRLSMVPRLYRTTLPPDVVVLHTTPPRDGKVSLGVEVNVLPAAIEAARAHGGLVVAQCNPAMPWTFGDAEISVDALDLAVEVESPLTSHVATAPSPESARIGALISERIGDGATLQAGIGEVPDAVVAGLTGRHNLRIWTEMFSDGVLALEQAGALDRGVPIRSSFLFGSPDLYAWVHDNPRVLLQRTERTNSPALIAQQPQMTSINTALQVDLFDQANASRINARIHSGFGGQTDYTVGAHHSEGGQSFMALRSWHPKADVSTIVPLLDEPVTSVQHTAVVTEQGIAWMWGHDERAQAEQLISNAAHPDVRDELWEEAAALGLV